MVSRGADGFEKQLRSTFQANPMPAKKIDCCLTGNSLNAKITLGVQKAHSLVRVGAYSCRTRQSASSGDHLRTMAVTVKNVGK
jgi:hypothetical protein